MIKQNYRTDSLVFTLKIIVYFTNSMYDFHEMYVGHE